jgi:quercetin dioxygenase-like cupin family protein
MELKQKPAVDQSLISIVTPSEDIINFQQGSVVSRTVIKKPTGTVTYFAFDEGEALSEHTAPFDALVSIVDGTAEVIISGVSYPLNKGEMIIMPANEPHAVKATSKFKMMLVMIKD